MSSLEDTFYAQIRMAGLPEPEREAMVIPGRRYRYDFCWRANRLLVEVQGGVWGKGAHSSGSGINRDTEKLNTAVLQGWRVLQLTTNQIRDGLALAWTQEALRRIA